MVRSGHRLLNFLLAVPLCLFTVAEVNYPRLTPQSQLAIFAMLGLMLCFVNFPFHRRVAAVRALRAVDGLLAFSTAAICMFVVIQSEPVFRRWWIDGISLGNRAGQEAWIDTVVGVAGLLLVTEATRRSIGWALPCLAGLFLAYAYFGSAFPDWLFPHRGYGVERIVAQTFLHSQGVFGTALRVMFVYVFLFVLFGAILRRTGATRYIIDLALSSFSGSAGGPAKVAVVSSGLMGSLSGSAVANTATTGTFTIPLMRSAGFKPEVAGGVEAAASTGGALVPPVMGAGAYMMLEIVEPAVTYLQIIKAALIPALIYYTSLLMIVHLYAKRIGLARREPEESRPAGGWRRFEGLVFVAGFATLLLLLLSGYTVFRAASVALLVVLAVGALNARTRLSIGKIAEALVDSARDAIPLVSAAACVGIVIGVVTLTGVGTKLPAQILTLSQGNLLMALVLIMVSSIILGMGLPSAVCYLLMATLVGPVLSQLGIVPLGAHLFIFYFGMMSMVTPPVALAAYTAGSIAGAGIMQTGFAAFRFALVGFTLPYMFVFRPALLMLDSSGDPAGWLEILGATALSVLGVVPFAAAIAGHLLGPLSGWQRALLLPAAAMLILPAPGPGWVQPLLLLGGVGLLLAVAISSRLSSRRG